MVFKKESYLNYVGSKKRFVVVKRIFGSIRKYLLFEMLSQRVYILVKYVSKVIIKFIVYKVVKIY